MTTSHTSTRAERRHGGTGEYHCPCGYRFPESLGKYGCANCCGEHEATLVLPVNGRNIDADLMGWAKWRRRGHGLSLGYPSQSTFAREIRNPGQATVPIADIPDPLAEAIDRAVSRLRIDEQRARETNELRYLVLVLHYIEGRSVKNIAEHLKCSRPRVDKALTNGQNFVEGAVPPGIWY